MTDKYSLITSVLPMCSIVGIAGALLTDSIWLVLICSGIAALVVYSVFLP